MFEASYRIDVDPLAGTEREKRWAIASLLPLLLDVALVPPFQYIGKRDIEIVEEANRLSKDGLDSSAECSIRFTDLAMQCLWWVLASYEMIRTIDQYASLKDSFLIGSHSKNIKQLKYDFERIRVPLAKHEAARRWKETDYRIPIPTLMSDNNSMGWQVSDKDFISRIELSDRFLGVFEGIVLTPSIYEMLPLIVKTDLKKLQRE